MKWKIVVFAAFVFMVSGYAIAQDEIKIPKISDGFLKKNFPKPDGWETLDEAEQQTLRIIQIMAYMERNSGASREFVSIPKGFEFWKIYTDSGAYPDNKDGHKEAQERASAILAAAEKEKKEKRRGSLYWMDKYHLVTMDALNVRFESDTKVHNLAFENLSKDMEKSGKDFDNSLASTGKKIEVLDEREKKRGAENSANFSAINSQLDGIDKAIKDSAGAAEARFAEYNKELKNLNLAIGKKADGSEINLVIQDFQKWQEDVGGDMYALADGVSKLAENQRSGMRTKTVPILDPLAGFFGHRRPVQLTEDGKKSVSEAERKAKEMMKRWEKYKK